MPSESATLDRMFHCLAHPARRAVVERLSVRPATMTELAAPANMALPSFLQHLRLLEDAGLIASEKSGRVRTYRLIPPAILQAEDWLEARRRQWNARLVQLDELLDRIQEKPNHG